MLREELGVEATLVKGRGGVFFVQVDGRTVAEKTWSGFPDEEEIVRAVAKAIGG